MAYRCYDMHAGILRHLPGEGGAMRQDDTLLVNMTYAVRTWQIDQRAPAEHTPEDFEFMQNVVQPPKVTDGR